jgi:hypothetical protein
VFDQQAVCIDPVADVRESLILRFRRAIEVSRWQVVPHEWQPSVRTPVRHAARTATRLSAQDFHGDEA